MVIGKLQQEPEGHPSPPAVSAWAEVEAAQRQVQLPCLLVPQPAHAVLAGELAAGLAGFGELPPEIKRAIQMHDTGWAGSDAQQIQRLRSGGRVEAAPVSFIAVAPEEAEEAWTASISTVEAFSRAGAMIISRHFSLIAQNDLAHHQRFLQAEKLRQRKLEDAAKADDLDRWTAALGFCDLVSLFLLSAPGRGAEFPLAHPSSPQAGTAPRVRMQIDRGNVRFTPEVVHPGCALSIQALRHPVPAQGARAETLTWHVQ
jgi:hypothetical protein